uniref:Uncharacterized protein n=1 Tax=Arundo donax TaxID=35708 RepID=A0A0A9ERF8_ARUDO
MQHVTCLPLDNLLYMGHMLFLFYSLEILHLLLFGYIFALALQMNYVIHCYLSPI